MGVKRWARRHEASLLAVGAATPVVAGVLLGLAQVEIPNATMWDEPSDPLTVVTVVAVGIAALYGVFQAFTQPMRARAARVAEAKLELAEQCREALVPINDRFPEVRLSQIGVHVWKVTDDGSQLEPVEKYTAGQRRTETPLKWTPGRGVAGLAWQDRNPVSRVGLQTSRAEANEMTEEKWAELDSRARLGLDQEQFVTASKFDAILACPLYAADEAGVTGDPPVLGVFTVDFMVGVDKDALDDLPNVPAFDRVVSSCEDSLRKMRS